MDVPESIKTNGDEERKNTSNSVGGKGEKYKEREKNWGEGGEVRTEKRKMQATSSQLLRWGSLDATLQKPEHPVPL